MEITREVALNILQSRSVVSEAGKYTAKVTSVNPYLNPETGRKSTIVNFNLMTDYQTSLAQKAFADGDYAGAINSTSMTASQLEGQYVPTKGETVDLEIVDHENKDGVTILVVDTIIARKSTKAKKFSFATVKEAAPAEAEIV